MRKNTGFTLVEILIVVVILGILAAIVIPQFSDASTQSKVSSMKSSLQTMRSQISLYAIQHGDALPGVAADLTGYTDCDGDVWATGAGTKYGPYLQSIPANPFMSGDAASTITIAAGVPSAPTAGTATVGWYLDTDTGKLYAMDGYASDSNNNGVTTDDVDQHINW